MKFANNFFLLLLVSWGLSAQHSDADILYVKGQKAMFSQKYLEGADFFQTAFEKERKSKKPRLQALAAMSSWSGLCYERAGENQKAIIAYRRGINLLKNRHPSFACQLLNSLAALHYKLKHSDQALRVYFKVTELAPDNSNEKVLAFSNIAGIFREAHKYKKAQPFYVKVLRINRKNNNTEGVSENLDGLAQVFRSQGNYRQAIDYQEKALAVAKNTQEQTRISRLLNNAASNYRLLGNYRKAMNYHKQALEISRKLKIDADISRDLVALGYIHHNLGDFDKAFVHYREALKIDEKRKNSEDIARDYNNIGQLYYTWGLHEKALGYYEKAMEINKDNEEKVALFLINMGVCYKELGHAQKALDHYLQSLKLLQKIGDQEQISVLYNNLGTLSEVCGEYSRAVSYFQNAIAIAEQIGNSSRVANYYCNLGNSYRYLGNNEQAISFLEKAVTIAEQLKERGQAAVYLNNLGGTYFLQGKYQQALPYYQKAIDYQESVLQTVESINQSDYLADTIHIYQFLASCHFRLKNYQQCYQVVESGKSKLLAAQLGRFSSRPVIPDIKKIQKQMPEQAAIIIYANSNWQNMLQIVITSDHFVIKEIDIFALVDQYKKIPENSQKDKDYYLQEQGENPSVKALVNMISHYRDLLKDPDDGQSQKREELAFALYRLLIKPHAKLLQNKKDWLIIPEGMLSILPFETLQDNNKKYMAQQYHIRYGHSLTVLELLRQRRYLDHRKSLLALGGAFYQKSGNKTRGIKGKKTPKEVGELIPKKMRQEIYWALEKKKNFRNIYQKLGWSSWSNLPGTNREIASICEYFEKPRILKGKDITERNIKEMSEKGELLHYKILHFAGHGLVVAEFPRLSALVLSQTMPDRKEDNYLRVEEIAGLRLKADFVNLSACSTGLGKIYRGQSASSLAQVFFSAGANGISLTLWEIDDEATQRFMKTVYRLKKKYNIDYAQAVTMTRRLFIRNDKYTNPYYWAPFVYYGKSGYYRAIKRNNNATAKISQNRKTNKKTNPTLLWFITIMALISFLSGLWVLKNRMRG